MSVNPTVMINQSLIMALTSHIRHNGTRAYKTPKQTALLNTKTFGIIERKRTGGI